MHDFTFTHRRRAAAQTRSWLLSALLAHGTLAGAARAQDASVVVEVLPAPVYIETGKSRQHLNFDFRLHNFGTTPVQMTRIELSVFDGQDKLEKVLFIDRGGTAPGLDSFVRGPVPGTGTLYVFNPYHDWDTEVELPRLEYVFTFWFRSS